MAKRRVPAALHHELTEYASLLRALRTRDAMDITKHLIKPSPFALPAQNNDDVELNSADDLDDELLDDSSRSHAPHPPSTVASDSRAGTPLAGPSNLNHPNNTFLGPGKTKSAKGKGKQKVVAPAPATKQRRRDHWTRWPLLLEDVLVPEWTLEDEVSVVASQVLKSRPPPAFPVSRAILPVDGEDENDSDFVYLDMEVDEDDPDPPFYAPYLTSIIATYLSTMLGLLASHTPARPASMQNRIEPLNWRAVIDVVVSCGVPEFSNPKVVQNVIKRMEAIYGPTISPIEGKKATSYRAVERMQGREAAAEKFKKLFEKEDATYFTQASPPPYRTPSPPPSPPKRKRSLRTRKEEADFKARKRWVPKDKKSKTQPQQPAETDAGQDAEREEPTVRRSGRAKAKVVYREIPPHDHAMEE